MKFKGSFLGISVQRKSSLYAKSSSQKKHFKNESVVTGMSKKFRVVRSDLFQYSFKYRQVLQVTVKG